MLMHAEAAESNPVWLIDGSGGRIVGQSRFMEIAVAVAGWLPAAVISVTQVQTELAIQEVNAHRVNCHRIERHEDAGRPLAVEEVAKCRLGTVVKNMGGAVAEQTIIDVEDGLVSQIGRAS